MKSNLELSSVRGSTNIRGKLLCLATNIRLGWIWLTAANTLAYYVTDANVLYDKPCVANQTSLRNNKNGGKSESQMEILLSTIWSFMLEQLANWPNRPSWPSWPNLPTGQLANLLMCQSHTLAKLLIAQPVNSQLAIWPTDQLANLLIEENVTP